MALHSKTIKVVDYDEFRDAIPTSGVFDMMDCAVEIWCPEASDVDEVQKMVNLLESMVHVTDIQIGSDIDNLASPGYRVVITEMPNDIIRKFTRKR